MPHPSPVEWAAGSTGRTWASLAGAGLTTWDIITPEFPPQPGGVADYTAQLASALEQAGQPVRVLCREFEGFTARGLAHVESLLNRSQKPRRLLLQYVPHGFGWGSMNLNFCRWVSRRPEPLEIMVHEPGLSFGGGGIRHDLIAAIHRVMLTVLLRRAEHVWISIPGWETRLRPYALGRPVPFTWLPVPSNIPVAVADQPATYRLGYFGQYDQKSSEVLGTILDSFDCPVLLIGRGAEQVRHPRAVIAGEMEPAVLSRALQSCDIVFHWYPDGVSSRRGTVMASLAHGRAVVTNEGRWTDPIWRKSGAVALASDAAGMALQLRRLMDHEGERFRLQSLSQAAYLQFFAIENTIKKLMAAAR